MPNAPFLAPERDSAFKRGRPKGGGVTYYTQPGVALIGSANTYALVSDTDFYTPYFVDTPLVVDQIAFHVTATGTATTARIGLYAADTDWQPKGAPLADSGAVSVAGTGLKTYTPGTPIFAARGRYLGVMAANGTVTVRCQLGAPLGAALSTSDTSVFATALQVVRSYAAFPTPGTAWDTEVDGAGIGKQNFIFWRVSQP
jgi:hypothetical protein